MFKLVWSEDEKRRKKDDCEIKREYVDTSIEERVKIEHKSLEESEEIEKSIEE